VGDVLEDALRELERLSPAELVARRYDKFRAHGVFDEG
jgi:acetyl-CoA carboxylase alpha subunit